MSEGANSQETPHKANPRLSVVFINHNTTSLLKVALETFHTNHPPFPVEVLIVDNASRDGCDLGETPSAAEAVWIRNRDNRGYGAAANQGIRAARGEFVAIANTDLEFLPGAVGSLVGFLEQNPDAGIVSPQLYWPDMSPQPTARRYPRFRYVLSGRRSPFGRLLRWRAGAREFLYAGIESQTGPVAVESVSGAFLVARRELLGQLKGFDEEYRFYVEDADLCRRARLSGKGVYVLPQAKVIHHLGLARRRVGPSAEFQRLRSFYRFFLREYPGVPGVVMLGLFSAYLAMQEARWVLGLPEWEYDPRGNGKS
jgi:N-acetylglucosaminyl-diphospho-decaprenol L-rhamnosyltransferase